MTVRDAATLSGPQQAELQAAMERSFTNRFAVEQFTLYSLDENLNTIVADVGLDQVFFRVIEWANSNGKIVLLVTKASARFPNNAELKAIADRVCGECPDPVSVAADTAQKRAEATQGLTALQQLMQDADVREAVGDFQSVGGSRR